MITLVVKTDKHKTSRLTVRKRKITHHKNMLLLSPLSLKENIFIVPITKHLLEEFEKNAKHNKQKQNCSKGTKLIFIPIIAIQCLFDP